MPKQASTYVRLLRLWLHSYGCKVYMGSRQANVLCLHTYVHRPYTYTMHVYVYLLRVCMHSVCMCMYYVYVYVVCIGYV